MVVIVVVVMDRCTVIIFFCVGQGLFRVVCEVRHVLLILIVAVMSLMCHWIFVVAVKTAVVVGAVIEVLGVIVSVMVTMLHLVVRVVNVSVVMLRDVLWLVQVSINWQVVVHISVMFCVMESVHVLNMVIVVVIVFVMQHGLNMLDNMVHDLVDHWLMDNFAVDDWLVDYFAMYDRLVDNVAMHDRLVDNFAVHDSLVVRNDNVVDETLGYFRVCLGFDVMTSCSLGRIESLSLMGVDIVTWGVVYRVVWCFVSYNVASDNLVVRANLFMSCQNIMVDKARLVNIDLVVLIRMNMSGHVFCVKFLGNLNVPRVVLRSRVANDWLVVNSCSFMVDRFVHNFGANRLVMNWLDLNVSNLWLISVLRNSDVALVGCARVNWLVCRLNVMRLLVCVIALSAVLVRRDLRLNIVVSIILSLGACLDRDNGGDDESKSLH